MQVVLEPLSQKHAAHLALNANNPKIARYMRNSFPYPYYLSSALAFVNVAAMQEERHFGVHRTIVADGRAAGCIGVTFQPDIYSCSAEIGYWIGEPYWGKGIAAEAVKQMSQLIFHEYDLVHRLYADVFAENKASQRVLEKAGYTLESIQKRRMVKDDVVSDGHSYVFLR